MSSETISQPPHQPPSILEKLKREGKAIFNRLTGIDSLLKAEAERKKALEDWLKAQGELIFTKNMGNPQALEIIISALNDLSQAMISSAAGKNGTMDMLKAGKIILNIQEGFLNAAKKTFPLAGEKNSPQED